MHPLMGSPALVSLVLQLFCLVQVYVAYRYWYVLIQAYYLLAHLRTHLVLVYHLVVSSAPSVLGVVILTSYNNIDICIVISFTSGV